MARKALTKEFYNTREAAKFLGVTSRTIRNWIRMGRIRVVMHRTPSGRYYYLIPAEEIIRLWREMHTAAQKSKYRGLLAFKPPAVQVGVRIPEV